MILLLQTAPYLFNRCNSGVNAWCGPLVTALLQAALSDRCCLLALFKLETVSAVVQPTSFLGLQ